ncbi:glycosyltransferase involved in cell wall biosynthesis [Flavobacterium araucananum]|uniref:Glycosyltransferase 2-like domain-containing protein n=1 Tax=Flavobacterium araucananum TaxID=946678 RepID=A0A227PFR0_9FLAO|nr:glycosyltransferase family A protein [Flavobacterium araucananum]OXG08760.1 hypothetical protein B0A64_04865 [Flavobacterium araucananum]PWJ97750.1 glycosyltransferase involved in cell wall biosynthesis [Flavobacterium araucananum]
MLQIYILTHNRPDLLVYSIDSILKQVVKNCQYELIVSDNSTNEDTEKLIGNNYALISHLHYRKRSPMTSIEHFNIVLSEITGDFFMMFHDDDTMFSNMIETLYNTISSDEKLLAVGSNAKLVRNGKVLRDYFNKSVDLVINSVDELILAHFNYYSAPFPSYIYRNNVAKNIKLDIKKGGKYCDVSFLLDIAAKGPIKIIAEPLMNYVLHKGQDSASYVAEQQCKMIQYMIKVSSFTKHSSLIMRVRLVNLYVRVLQSKRPISCRRWRKIQGIFFKFSPFTLFPRIVIKRILKLS